MHAVVNHLRFQHDIDPDLFSSMDEVVAGMRAIDGFAGLQIVQISAREVMLLVLADTPETLDRASREVGSPWMVANIVPLLAFPPDRHTGPVLVTG